MLALPLFAGLMLGAARSAHAQGGLGDQGQVNIDAGRAPTDFLTRVRLRNVYADLSDDTKFNSLRLIGEYAPHPSLSLRLEVPLNYLDPGFSDASSEFGLGDLRARALWRFWHSGPAAAVVGVDLFFPTATDPLLGTEKYSVAFTAAFVYQIENIFLIPVYQQLVSYAGKDSRADIDIARFRPIVLAQWPHGWWTALDPGFLWDLEDDLPTEDTFTLGLELGKALTDRLSISTRPAIRAYGSEDFGWSVELAFSYHFE